MTDIVMRATNRDDILALQTVVAETGPFPSDMLPEMLISSLKIDYEVEARIREFWSPGDDKGIFRKRLL